MATYEAESSATAPVVVADPNERVAARIGRVVTRLPVHIFLAFIAVPESAAVNYVPNPGFETCTASPASWAAVASELRLLTEVARARDDRYQAIAAHLSVMGCDQTLIARGLADIAGTVVAVGCLFAFSVLAWYGQEPEATMPSLVKSATCTSATCQ